MNYYGQTKLLSENCFNVNHETIIIRTSWVYSVFGNNFVKKILDLMKLNDEISIVNDQFGSPTYAADLAFAILSILTRKWKRGIYHFSSDESISWYDFANRIKNINNSNCKITPINSTSFKTLALRPSFSTLS